MKVCSAAHKNHPFAKNPSKNVIRHLCHRHLDTELSLTSQQQIRMNRLRLEVSPRFPLLIPPTLTTKHPIHRQYSPSLSWLNTTSSGPQSTSSDSIWKTVLPTVQRRYIIIPTLSRSIPNFFFLKSQATVTLKKRLAATDGTVSRGRKSARRSEKADQQSFVQGPSRSYDYGSQLYTYPPPSPVNDPTTTNHGWYGGYSYSQTSKFPIPPVYTPQSPDTPHPTGQDYGTKQIYENSQVYPGSQIFSQPMPTP